MDFTVILFMTYDTILRERFTLTVGRNLLSHIDVSDLKLRVKT